MTSSRRNLLAGVAMLTAASSLALKATPAMAEFSWDQLSGQSITVMMPEHPVTDGIRTVPLWEAAIPFLGIAGDPRAVPALIAVLEDAEAPLDGLVAAVEVIDPATAANVLAPFTPPFAAR